APSPESDGSDSHRPKGRSPGLRQEASTLAGQQAGKGTNRQKGATYSGSDTGELPKKQAVSRSSDSLSRRCRG
ncbi:hypothetical protein B8W95_13940, partial [Staphylococcus pasteuri]